MELMITEAICSAKRWRSKVAVSIADQGLASGAHFLLNVLLARWLSPSEYGAFAIAFSVFLFAWGIHSSVLVEPMTIVGPSRYEGRLPTYVGAAIWIHGLLSVVMAIALLLISGALRVAGSSLSPGMFGMSVASPFLLLVWLLRRACYLDTRPSVAVKGSLFYFVLLLVGLAVMWRFRMLSPVHAFVLLGGSSLAASAMFWRLLSVQAGFVKTASGRAEVAAVVKQHWMHGKWFLRTTIMYWLANSVYLPLVGVLSGLGAVGAFRAIDNLFRPMAQTLTALSLLFLPWVSARSERQGPAALMGTALRISVAMLVLTGSYLAGILIAGRYLIEAIYGGGYYSQFFSLIPFVGIALVLRGIGDNGFAVVSKAAKWPDIVFWATLASAGATLSAGLYLVKRYGPTGAAAGWMLSSAVHVMVTVWLFWSRMKRR